MLLTCMLCSLDFQGEKQCCVGICFFDLVTPYPKNISGSVKYGKVSFMKAACCVLF